MLGALDQAGGAVAGREAGEPPGIVHPHAADAHRDARHVNQGADRLEQDRKAHPLRGRHGLVRGVADGGLGGAQAGLDCGVGELELVQGRDDGAVRRQAHRRIRLDPLAPAGEGVERGVAAWDDDAVGPLRDGAPDALDEGVSVLERVRQADPLGDAARPVSGSGAGSGDGPDPEAGGGEAPAGGNDRTRLAVRDEDSQSVAGHGA
jgi:hypothetical protein